MQRKTNRTLSVQKLWNVHALQHQEVSQWYKATQTYSPHSAFRVVFQCKHTSLIMTVAFVHLQQYMHM